MKVLFFDIENIHRPEHIFNRGRQGKFGSKPAGFCADLAYILVFGYKWLGDDRAKYIIASKKDFKKDPLSDASILDQIYSIMNEAEVIVTWYGANHDFPFVTARLAQQGKFLDQQILHIDLQKLARKALPLSSNRLNNVAKFFGKELKTSISPAIWAKTWMGDYDALVEMADYCVQDVEVLSQLYDSLKVLGNKMPHFGVDQGLDKHKSCRHCGSQKLIGNGRRVTKSRTYSRLRCPDCGGGQIGEPV